jgi:MFS family permease
MNPSLLWIAAALFTWGVGEGMFYMFQPIYLSQLGANPVQIGYILGSAGFALMIAHIPAGYLADRIGRRPLLITGWLIGIISTLSMALAPSLPFFVAGLLLYATTGFVTSPLNSYVTAARGNWSVGRAITLISSTYNLGIVFGPFTGGWIGDHFGLRSVYYLAGALFIVSTIFLLMIAISVSSSSGFSLCWRSTCRRCLLRNSCKTCAAFRSGRSVCWALWEGLAIHR